MGPASACVPLFPCLSSLPLSFLCLFLALFLSPRPPLSLALPHMGTVPESGSDNRATRRQGQEAGAGRLARALAQALTRIK